MYEPSCDDEITGLVGYLDDQLAALRAATVGLTDEQARIQPCRSALSVGGLLKHATYCMSGAVERLTNASTGTLDLGPEGFASYESSFVIGDGETAESVLAEFDVVRTAYLAAVAGADPNGATLEPPAPWAGIFDARPARTRYFLVHQIEEMARHAGHADILREEIDGMAVPAIVLSEEGVPANEFFQPFVAEAGTLGAR